MLILPEVERSSVPDFVSPLLNNNFLVNIQVCKNDKRQLFAPSFASARWRIVEAENRLLVFGMGTKRDQISQPNKEELGTKC